MSCCVFWPMCLSVLLFPEFLKLTIVYFLCCNLLLILFVIYCEYSYLVMGPSFVEGGPIMYRCCPFVCLSVRLSVRPSVCPVPPPRGKTKRPRKTKVGVKGPWDTSTPRTNFKVPSCCLGGPTVPESQRAST